MALIWLPDSCELPNSVPKRKRKAGDEPGGLGEPMAFGKRTASVASMSSVGSFHVQSVGEEHGVVKLLLCAAGAERGGRGRELSS